ncbi:transposase [Pelagicoccus sp. NFK12]|uniref:Transposase n=2 Tax=Pelagicoccus enzymogenes TaxID=2773457 RepID=A0A927IIC0_9BACT|nr:transposase [Pelagicoccus enzymogenes]
MPGARYFVTLCVAGRKETLRQKAAADTLFRQLDRLHADQEVEMACAVVMPDHMHLLFRLGSSLSLGRVVSKFKTLTRSAARWQKDFYDHRLREDESEEAYGFYVFMNPYTKGLLALDERWDCWRRWRVSPYRFEALLDRDGVVPENWLRLARSQP